MAIKISNLQVRETRDFGPLVTKNSLTAIGQREPQKLSKMVTFLYDSMRKHPTFSRYLEQNATTRIVDNDEEIRWKVQGSSVKTVSLVECRINGTAVTSSSNIGVGKSVFELVFPGPEPYFSDVDMIASEAGPAYQIRIVGEPLQEGSNWVYPAKLMGGDSEASIPYALMTPGKQFSKEFPIVEDTLSKKGASFNYSSPAEMRNRWTKARWQDKVPGNMINKALVWTYEVVDDNGKVTKAYTWDTYAEWERRVQMMRAQDIMINNARWNADSNGNILDIGLSGYEIEQGSGLEEQLESGHKQTYNTFDINVLGNMITELSDGTEGYEDRVVAIRTGKWGAIEAFRQIQDKATSFTPLQSDKFLGKSATPGTLSFNPSITEWVNGAGIRLRFFVDPFLDDQAIAKNTVKMGNGLPGNANSYTFQVLNIGSTGGDSNIEILYHKTKEMTFKYTPGIRDPYQSDQFGIAAIPDDGFGLHYMTPRVAVIVKDPSRCFTYKPSVLEY